MTLGSRVLINVLSNFGMWTAEESWDVMGLDIKQHPCLTLLVVGMVHVGVLFILVRTFRGP